MQQIPNKLPPKAHPPQTSGIPQAEIGNSSTKTMWLVLCQYVPEASSQF